MSCCNVVSRATSEGSSGRKGSSKDLRSPAVCRRRSMPSSPHQLVKPEARADHADRTEQRTLLAEDFIAGKRQPVTARGRDVLGKGDDRDTLLLRQLSDAAKEQCGLNRRAAGGVNHDRDRDDPGATERLIDRRCVACQRYAAAPRARHDDPLESQNRHDGAPPPQIPDIEMTANAHGPQMGIRISRGHRKSRSGDSRSDAARDAGFRYRARR